MIKSDYVLMILNCKKYQYKAELQKKGWLNNIELFFDLKYFHVIGDKELCKEKEYIFDFENKILYVNSEDDYLHLPKKVITAFKAINDTFNYKYILKTDDDIELAVKGEFSKIIFLLEKNISYYGGFVNSPGKLCGPWFRATSKNADFPKNILLENIDYCSGRFYYLYKNAVIDLLNKSNLIKYKFIEDHSIGLYLNDFFKKNIIHISKLPTIFAEKYN